MSSATRTSECCEPQPPTVHKHTQVHTHKHIVSHWLSRVRSWPWSLDINDCFVIQMGLGASRCAGNRLLLIYAENHQITHLQGETLCLLVQQKKIKCIYIITIIIKFLFIAGMYVTVGGVVCLRRVLCIYNSPFNQGTSVCCVTATSIVG